MNALKILLFLLLVSCSKQSITPEPASTYICDLPGNINAWLHIEDFVNCDLVPYSDSYGHHAEIRIASQCANASQPQQVQTFKLWSGETVPIVVNQDWCIDVRIRWMPCTPVEDYAGLPVKVGIYLDQAATIITWPQFDEWELYPTEELNSMLFESPDNNLPKPDSTNYQTQPGYNYQFKNLCE